MRAVVGGLMVAAVCVGCVSAAIAPGASPPQAKVDNAIQTLGEIKTGDLATAVFVVRNEGLGLLTLAPGSVSCDCARVIVDPAVEAGAAAQATVTVDSTGLPLGGASVSISLKTNDPSQPELALTVRLFITPRIEAFPGYARYSYVQGERSGTITQQLWALDGRDFRVLRVETPYAFLATEFHEAAEGERRKETAPGRQWIVSTTIPPTAAVGALIGNIQIHTDHPAQPVVEIPLSGFVRPIFAVTPTVADFGKLTVGTTRRARAFVANYATEDIGITKTEVDNPLFRVEVVPTQPGRRYSLWVTVHSANVGVVEGKAFLYTESQKVPRIEVPLRAEFLPAN